MRLTLHGLVAASLLMLVAAGARAQVGPAPAVPGEIIAYVQAGQATAAEVGQMAAAAGAQVVRPLLMQDVYLLRVPGNDTGTAGPIAALKATGKFRWVAPNYRLDYLDSTPGDPRYREQWYLPLMNMPKAWDIEKGKSTVTIMIVDSGCQVTHPDLASRIVGRRNFFDPTTPDDVTDNVPHGTHVAGISAAATDNNVGVAGVAWEGAKLFIAKAGDTGGLPHSALVDSISYARQTLNTGGQRVVINMSLGGSDVSDTPDMSSPLNVAILQAANEGIVFSIAAGNSFDTGNPPINPANMAQKHPNILCISACGPRKEHAAYSSARAYTTVTAPGGNILTVETDGMLNTVPTDAYEFLQGTSMAAPAATGVIALLLSADVEPALIKDILTSSADKLNMAVPNDQFGWGVIDAYAALQNIRSVTITAPSGTGGKAAGQTGVVPPIETLRPTVSIDVRQLTPDEVTVRVDGTVVPRADWLITDVRTTEKDPDGADVPTSFTISFTRDLSPGRHTVEVVGTGGTPPKTVTDIRYVTITPHVVPAGRSMVSIPFLQNTDAAGNPLTNSAVLQYYFGADYRLARWDATNERYAFMTSYGLLDPAFIPPPALQPKLNGVTPVFPLGVGLWSDVVSAKPILTRGAAQTSGSVHVPLVGNANNASGGVRWNMVGDPYPFDVPFNALLVQTPAGILPIKAAADQGYLLPNLYTYDPTVGYVFDTLPNGTLKAWTGYWVGVTSTEAITLIIPPAGVTRAAAVAGRSAVAGKGWTMQLSASAGDQRDTNNWVGVSSVASDGYDVTDVAEPPAPSPYVTLAIQNANWSGRSGLYTRDIRAPGASKSWDVVVRTDKANVPVTISWGGAASLPRGLSVTFTDKAASQVVDMRTRSSYTFTSGDDGAVRVFTLSTSPGTRGPVRVSNLVVRPSGTRASGASSIEFTLSGDATYEVAVLGANGRQVATVATRAAASGPVRVVWNGKDAAGRSVPAGMYMVRVRAATAEGASVNVVQPFAVVR